ncbi:uncharacterized protein LOC110985278 isoform X2 [Acanthaster planci]|uniref:Uncharacterized protein LOC110985278 isoform X2 n=1 Tax=Acanthaster planci TaxID=133434 RepID=A0A8B7Z8A4_ACAPL|nr:uncharacterized protein LOC110985278 isoform X2 [Acanthaster planci]
MRVMNELQQTASHPRGVCRRNSSIHGTMNPGPLWKQQHPKSSRRLLFKENMSPRSKTLGKVGIGRADRSKEPSRNKLPQVQENVSLQPTGNLTGNQKLVVSHTSKENNLSASRVRNLPMKGLRTHLSEVDFAKQIKHRAATMKDTVKRSVQNNVTCPSGNLLAKKSPAKEIIISLKGLGNISDIEMDHRPVPVDSHLISNNYRSERKVQDNMAYDRTFTDCREDEVTLVGMTDKLLAVVPALAGTGWNCFEADQSGLMNRQRGENSRLSKNFRLTVQDNVLCKLSVQNGEGSGSEPSNSILTTKLEENEESSGMEPAGSDSDQVSLAEESHTIEADNTAEAGSQDSGSQDSDEQELTRTPEQWLVEPLQRLSLGIGTDQSDCLQESKGILGTHSPGLLALDMSQFRARTGVPSRYPKECLPSVHREEESVMHSPVPLSDDPYFFTSPHHQPLQDDHTLHHGLNGLSIEATNLSHTGNHQFRQKLSFYATRGDHQFDSSTDSPHLDDQHWPDTAPITQPDSSGSALDENSETEPNFSTADYSDKWYSSAAPNGWVEVPVHSPTSLYSQITNPAKLLVEVTSVPQCNLDFYGSEPLSLYGHKFNSLPAEMEPYSVLESDKNQPTSRHVRNADTGDTDFNLPFTRATINSTHQFSSKRLAHPNTQSFGSLDISQPGDPDLRELDQLDDADLYRFSEADEFVHSNPTEGLYAQFTPRKGDENRRVRRTSKKPRTNETGKKLDEEKDAEEQDKDKDSQQLGTGKEPAKNWNNNNVATDEQYHSQVERHSMGYKHRVRQQNSSRSPHGYIAPSDNEHKVLLSSDRLAGGYSPELSANSSHNYQIATSLVGHPTRLTSRSILPSEGSGEAVHSSLLRERMDRSLQSSISLSPSTVTVDTAVLHTKLQYNLQSGGHLLLQSGMHDPTPDTKISPLRHSYPGSPGVGLTIDDLNLSVSPIDLKPRKFLNSSRSRVENQGRFPAVNKRRKDKNEIPTREHASGKSSLSEAVRSKQSKNYMYMYVDQSSSRTQHRNTESAQQRTKTKSNLQHLARVPKPLKSEGVPKKRHTMTASTAPESPLTLSSSTSPRRTFSILWAFKILDILHSAPPDMQEELVTKLYWFRRWHRNVRLIRVQKEERKEQWNRAVSHCRHRLLARCVRTWRLAPLSHKRAADHLRAVHLLRKGVHGLWWAVSQSRQEIEGAVERYEKRVKCRHFAVWRDLCQVRTERAQLLEKLAAKRSITVIFQTWKERYNFAQKDGIARLHYKVSLLTRGLQRWKLFTSQSKVRGYRDEMSRVHHEEMTVRKAWCTIKAVYAQTQKAHSHYSHKLLSAVLRTWVRGSQLAKAERHHQHSQALELRRCGLVRVHFKRWKEELFVMQLRKRLDTVRKRYVWDLWTLRLQRQQLYRQIMESQARKVAKQRIFTRWMQVARRQKEAAERAAAMLRRTYLQMVFGNWRSYVNKAQKLRSTLSAITSDVHLRSKQRTLQTWTSRLRDCLARQAAQRAWSKNCVLRAVSKWKERVRRRQMEERLEQFRPVHDEHMKRDAFRRWVREFRLALQDHQRALSAQHKLLRNQLLRLLLSWQLLVKESKTIAPLLERRDLKQLTNSFDAWREVVFRKRTCKKYQALQLSRSLGSAFKTWREQVVSRKELVSIQESLMASKLTRAFLGWKAAIQWQVSLKAFLRQRQEAMVRRIFEGWRKTAEEEMLLLEVEQGGKMRDVLLKTLLFKKWSKSTRQQKVIEASLVSDQRMRRRARTIRAAYKQWKRQFLVQIIARDAQADKDGRLLHRVFLAWHQETRSTYEQLTERFQLAYDAMSSSFPSDGVSPKSTLAALTLDLPQSLSSSSGGSQGLPAHLSTADSGYGNGLAPLQQEGHSCQETPRSQGGILDKGRSSGPQDENFQLETGRGQVPPPQLNRYRGALGATRDIVLSSDDDLYPDELPQQVGSPRFREQQHHLKPRRLLTQLSSSKFDTQPKSASGLQAPVSGHPISFLRRRASLDQNILSRPQADHRHPMNTTTSSGAWGSARSASMDQGLLSSPAVIRHLRNVHRKSQTENPMLFSWEEAPAVGSDSGVHDPPLSKSSSQTTSSQPQRLQTPKKHRSAQLQLSTSPSSHAFLPLQGSLSSPSHTPGSASPRSPDLSKSLSPLSPRSRMHFALSEGQSQTISDSRHSSISESSSTGPGSTHSSSYYMQLVGCDQSQSGTASEYAPSVFSDGAPPVSPRLDQRTYLRSIILHWRLWPASAAFNQWLDYVRYRKNLREISEQADWVFHQVRLRRALATWQRRCYVERLARNHWEMRTKAIHLMTWMQHSQDHKRCSRQKVAADSMACGKRLASAFHFWKTKYKKHKAVLSIVHNWKGYVQQTVDLEDRTKDLRHQIQRRTARECFRSWKLRTWQILEVKAHRNRVITKRCLVAWAVWSREATARREKLQSFQTRRIKLLVFHCWQSHLTKLQAARGFHHRATAARLRNIVRTWSTYIASKQQLEATAARMIHGREERMVVEAWKSWKRQVQRRQQMKQLYLTNLARRHLLAWHIHASRQQTLNVASAVAKDRRNTSLLQNSLQAWRRARCASQLACQMQARLGDKLIRKAFWDWRKYTRHCRCEKYGQMRLLKLALHKWRSRCVKQKSSRQTVLRVAHHWRKQAQRSKDLDQSLDSYLARRDAMKRRQALEAWMLAWQQQRRAVAHHSSVALGRCLSAWCTFASNRRQRQTALQLWQNNKCRKMLSASFEKWRKNHRRCLELETRMAGFHQQRAAELLAAVVRAWHHVTMEGVAVRRHNRAIQAKAWQHWQKALSNTQAAMQVAETRQTQVNHAIFRALRDWCRGDHMLAGQLQCYELF